MKDEDIQKQNYFIIQETERQRIAKDLHDDSLQNLTHIIHQIELAQLCMNQDTIKTKLVLAEATKDLKKVIDEIRETIFDLRPMSIDDLGMRETLIQLVNNLNNRYSSSLIQYDIDEVKEFDNNTLLDIYRVIQEYLGNSVRHSRGKNIFLKVSHEKDFLTIEISDDGIGFNYEEKKKMNNDHFGLKIAEGRILFLKGIIKVDSLENQGTRISIQIPETESVLHE